MALRDLRYFIAAAEEQHFGRAAQKLRISQPAISRQIQDLEAEIGTQLFERMTRGVRLSKSGEIFFQQAKQVILAYNNACEQARKAGRGEVGQLRVGFNDFSLGYRFVSDALKDFRTEMPDISLELMAMPSVKQLELISNEKMDAGFLYYFESDDDLDFWNIGTENIVLAIPADHRLAVKRSVVVNDLTDEPFIGIKRDAMPHHYDHLIAACRRGGLTPRIIQETHNESTLLRLVAVEMGVGFVRSSLASQLPKNVCVRRVAGISMVIRFGLAWRKGGVSPALQSLISLVRSRNKRN